MTQPPDHLDPSSIGPSEDPRDPRDPGDSRIDEQFLDRYLAGESSPDEYAAFARHLPAQMTPETIANRLGGFSDRLLDRIDDPATTSSEFATLMRAYERRAADVVLGRTSQQHPRDPGAAYPYTLPRQTHLWQAHSQWRTRAVFGTALAASVLAVAAVATLMYLHSSHSPARDRLLDGQRYATTTGQRATYTLRDGTRVTLAPSSSVVVENTLATGVPSVYVTGQAYFDVVAHATQPFTVNTPHSTARVLGTAFSVREYPNDAFVEVAVATGKVALENMVLAAGQIGRATHGRVFEVTDADAVARATSWVNGRLVFKDALVRDILPELSRWYGVTFVAGDATINDLHFSGAFGANSVADVTDVLRQTLGLRTERQGNVVILSSHQ